MAEGRGSRGEERAHPAGDERLCPAKLVEEGRGKGTVPGGGQRVLGREAPEQLMGWGEW